MKGQKLGIDDRLAAPNQEFDAVDAHLCGGHRALRIDQMLETFLSPQPARHNAGGADLDDLVVLSTLARRRNVRGALTAFSRHAVDNWRGP